MDKSLYSKIAKVIADVKKEYPNGMPSVEVEKKVDNMLAGLLNEQVSSDSNEQVSSDSNEQVSVNSSELEGLKIIESAPALFFINITNLEEDHNVRTILHANGYMWNGGTSLLSLSMYTEGQKLHYGVYSKEKVMTYSHDGMVPRCTPVLSYDDFINEYTTFENLYDEVADTNDSVDESSSSSNWHGFTEGEEVIANIGRPVPAKFIRPFDNDFALVKCGSTGIRISHNNISKYDEEIPGLAQEQDTQINNQNNNEVMENVLTIILPRYLKLGSTIYNPTYGTGRVDVNVMSSPNPYFTASFDSCDVSVTFGGDGKVDCSSDVRPSVWPDEELYIKYPTDAMKAWDEFIKNKRWRASADGGMYYTIDSNDWSVIAEYDNRLKTDDNRWKSGNYFKNREDAKKATMRIQTILTDIHLNLFR